MAAKAHYACFALLLLFGIQFATCKSVDETFLDDHYNTRILNINKRDVNEENNEEETTTSFYVENEESDNSEESTPIVINNNPKASRKPKPIMRRWTTTARTSDDESITTLSEDGDEVQDAEDEEGVPPTEKPTLSYKPKSKNQKKVKPATIVPTISDRINTEEEEGEEEILATDLSHLPKQPASNLLPPMANNYHPQNFNGFITPTQNQAFAPWGFNPMYASLPTAYDYPRPSGPAFSDSKGFASASASASGSGGSGGTVFASTSPGNGYHHVSDSFGTRTGSNPVGGNHQSTDSFVNVRGSFPASDGESVAIEVNGPVSSGAPGYEQTYAGNGANYAQSGSHAPNSYANAGGNYPTYISPADLQGVFQQYFAALQAQQLAFQQQLQAQIEMQRQAGGSTFTSSAAYITNDRGMVNPKAQVYVNTYTSPIHVSSASVDSRSGLENSRRSVSAFPSTSNKNHNRIWEQSNQVDSNFNSYGAPHSSVPQSAYASANLGSNGGFQTAHINSAGPGIFSRFGEDIPPPSGNQFGVFSSSSSSTHTGPDGKQVSRKSATVGINDNGKISYKTVHDP